MSETNFDFQKWDEEIEELEEENKVRLYEQMKEQLEKGEKSEVLWRLAKASLILSIGAERDMNTEQQKQFIEDAIEYGRKSCELDPNIVESHKWYCAALGKIAKFVGAKQKIKYGQQFKEHADIALKLDPNDYLLHYMFGRFCYEVSSLSWFERQIASALFGSVPDSSFEEALNHFTICDQLKPKWKDNYLWIAKTLCALKRYSEAREWTKKGLDLSVHSLLDEMADKNLNKLKNKHNFND